MNDKLNSTVQPPMTDLQIAFANLGKPVNGAISDYTAMLIQCVRLIDRIDDAIGNSNDFPNQLVGFDAPKARPHLQAALKCLEEELTKSVTEAATKGDKI